MSAVLQESEKLVHWTTALEEVALSPEQVEIAFANVARGRVGIEITLHGGHLPLAPGLAVIQAAPLGAFVPWKPLAMLPVPSLQAGETRVLRLQAAVPRTAVLGDPAKIPPHRLLTALAEEDEPEDAMSATVPLPSTTAPLANDVFALLGRENPHWAGNLNVFVNDRAVERHLAQALRIYPGRLNLAMFVVGSGSDAYSFTLKGSGAAWDAALHDVSCGSRFSSDPQNQIPLKKWIPMDRMRVLMLAIRPPRGCGEGEVEVHVRQRSTGKKAVVEFTLDERGVGPGCFVV
jgi:hypothetical protein